VKLCGPSCSEYLAVRAGAEFLGVPWLDGAYRIMHNIPWSWLLLAIGHSDTTTLDSPSTSDRYSLGILFADGLCSWCPDCVTEDAVTHSEGEIPLLCDLRRVLGLPGRRGGSKMH
jgi:hypothetical protein